MGVDLKRGRKRVSMPWLFVTGAPRSGTTFLAEILRSAPGACYVHEPFNPSCSVGGLRDRYVHLTDDDPRAGRYSEVVSRILSLDRLEFRRRTWDGDSALRRMTKIIVGGRGAFHYRLARYHPFPRVGILKDPTAAFMTPFLEDLDFQTLVVIRHPASWVASFLRTGWSPELELLRRQDSLMDTLPADDRALLTTSLDRLEQIAVFWRVVYGFLTRSDETRNRIVVVHETVSSDPLTQFENLFEKLGVGWSNKVERKISRLTGSGSADGRSGRLSDLRRDSASIFETRIDALSSEQREVIAGITDPIASRFYSGSRYSLETSQ